MYQYSSRKSSGRGALKQDLIIVISSFVKYFLDEFIILFPSISHEYLLFSVSYFSFIIILDISFTDLN